MQDDGSVEESDDGDDSDADENPKSLGKRKSGPSAPSKPPRKRPEKKPKSKCRVTNHIRY